MKIKALFSTCAILCLCLFPAGPAPAAGADLLVFAAASTTNAMTDIGQAFQARTGVKAVNSLASSSTLAKQIEQGAPAHVFLSANVKWMDYLAQAGAIDPATRFNLLKNRLTLIAPAKSPLTEVALTQATDLAALLGGSRLAMGDPAHVPAGIYAKQALEGVGLWPQVQDKIAAAANVRIALAMVEGGEAPLGVVYATDAAISDKVKVVGLFPLESHPPIVYPAALVKGQTNPAAGKYLDFLKSDQAKAVFAKYGFQAY